MPRDQYLEEVKLRYEAMEAALRELDKEGFFGIGAERAALVINVVAPGEESEWRSEEQELPLAARS